MSELKPEMTVRQAKGMCMFLAKRQECIPCPLLQSWDLNPGIVAPKVLQQRLLSSVEPGGFPRA